MSQLALFGATGRVGRRILAGALASGHAVRALVRDPQALPAGPGLDVVLGDVLVLDDVRQALHGADGVLSTLGGGTTAAPGTARSQGMRNIVSAMEALGIERIVALGGAGVLDADSDTGLRSEREGYPERFKRVSAEHLSACRALQGSGLAWTFVGPPDIPDGDATGQYRVCADRFPAMGKALFTGDLAAFMLEELTARRFVGHRVGIAT